VSASVIVRIVALQRDWASLGRLWPVAALEEDALTSGTGAGAVALAIGEANATPLDACKPPSTPTPLLLRHAERARGGPSLDMLLYVDHYVVRRDARPGADLA